MTKPRAEVTKENCWNVEALYPSLANWQEEFKKVAPPVAPPTVRWPELNQFRGTLGQGPEQLKKALEIFLQIDRTLGKLATYAHLKHDEDIADNGAKVAYSEAGSAYNDLRQETAWFEPELMSLSDETIQSYLKSPVLKDYHFYLEKIFRGKPHTLSADKEWLLALSQKPLGNFYKSFNAITDADFVFPQVKDKEGNLHELSHARFSLYLKSPDRILRENTFKAYFGKYKDFENTLCELLSGQVESHVYIARARNFPSALDAALFSKNVPTSVYHSLIEAVHQEIGALHRYIKLRAETLKLKPLKIFDLQVPLVPDFDLKISYEEAENLVIESVTPLGTEYQEILRKGLKQDRWVDRYENKNKRSGAYSSGCYDSMPYILMNYKEIIRDLFTLAHEAGHSMHSYYSRKHQPYQYSDYSIFVAEVASTFNEELLMQQMLKSAKSDEEKIYLITQKIEDLRGTLFRQTQFAEFELLIHTLAEKNIPITPTLLNEEYLKMNKFYYGPALENDPEVGNEWSRIPHFYYNFYVYQYATGISAALALADRVLNGGPKERDAYLDFLKSGESVYPIEALKRAGVDMSTVTPVKQAIHRFNQLLDQLEQLLKKRKVST